MRSRARPRIGVVLLGHGQDKPLRTSLRLNKQDDRCHGSERRREIFSAVVRHDGPEHVAQERAQDRDEEE